MVALSALVKKNCQLVVPPELKARVVNLRAGTARVRVNRDGDLIPGFAISGTIEVEVPDTLESASRTVSVLFPVMPQQGHVLPVTITGTPRCDLTVHNFATRGDLASYNTYIVLPSAVVALGVLVVAAAWVVRSRALRTEHVILALLAFLFTIGLYVSLLEELEAARSWTLWLLASLAHVLIAWGLLLAIGKVRAMRAVGEPAPAWAAWCDWEGSASGQGGDSGDFDMDLD